MGDWCEQADERAAEFIAEPSEEEDDEEEQEDEEQEQELEAEDQMPEPTPPPEVDEPAVGASGRPSRRAAKRKQSYNEDDYYKKVGGDALVAKGRKARKAEEAQRLEQEQRAKKRKAKPKHGSKGKKSRTSSATSAEGTSSVGRKYAEAEYAVDGQRLGNVGRFFNHSAQPNLFMQCVHTGSTPGGHHGKYDDRMPTLAFFAMKDIPPMTELTFDYGKSHAEMHKLHDNIACS